MRFDYGYDEEQRLGKRYDLKLLQRIWPYTAPHRAKLAVSVLMVVTITLLELSIPYITKEIIDRHIVPRTRITDAGLQHLEGLANLQCLNVSDTLVTPEGIRKLRRAHPNWEIKCEAPSPLP